MEKVQSLTITVTPDKTLELPAELQSILNPGEQYLVSITGDTITLTRSKVGQSSGFDWEKWEQNLEAVGNDPNQLSTEEICEIVRDVRRNRTV